MVRITFLLMASMAFSGCALTRVSDADHAKEVNELEAVGLSLDAARSRATGRGFICDTLRQDVSVKTANGVRKTTVLECYKKSFAVMCPQSRYVVFNAEPLSSIVYSVGHRLRQHTCF